MLSKPRQPVFYGWWVVVCCTSITLYTSGVVHFGFTALFEPVAQEFEWSYAQISLAASLRGLETGLLSPLIGMLVDRWGPRRLAFVGILITGLGIILLSRINSLMMFYAAFFLIATGTSASGHAAMLPAVANWFQRRAGTAIGIVVSGAALGGALVPVVTILIDRLEWRTAMLILGLGTWAICLPLTLLLRNRPEDYGWWPDGDRPSDMAAGGAKSPAKGVAATGAARAVFSQRAFWQITLAFTFQGMVSSAVLTHVMPYLSTVGIPRSTASLVASIVPVVSIAGRLSFGWVAGRFGRRKAVLWMSSMSAVGLLSFGLLGYRMWFLAPFLLFYSIGWGSSVTMRPALLTAYFGREKFATIHGMNQGVIHFGAMIGPPLAGWVFDEWRGYQGVWFILAGVIGVAVLILAAMPRPKNGPVVNHE
ncbi:MAG: MFS transporter [Chloroflexi bacterium]|nr:MFS transporter [Chloroflexota bacterium]